MKTWILVLGMAVLWPHACFCERLVAAGEHNLDMGSNLLQTETNGKKTNYQELQSKIKLTELLEEVPESVDVTGLKVDLNKLQNFVEKIVDEKLALLPAPAPGPTGPEGPEGPQGPEGPRGPEGVCNCPPATTTTSTVQAPNAAWELAINLNPSDGHRMGFGSNAWFGDANLGSAANALTEDYVSNAAYNQISNYVAIARHPIGSDTCEAVKVWKWSETGRTFHHHMNTAAVTGTVPAKTNGGAVYEYNPVTLPDKDTDPIFGNSGDLQVNYYYSNNGVRIVLTGAFGYPTTDNTDDIHGFGNEFGASTSEFQGSDNWWHDIAQRYHADCHGNACPVMGTDHGTAWNAPGSVSYQYAVYTSMTENSFACAGEQLHAP